MVLVEIMMIAVLIMLVVIIVVVDDDDVVGEKAAVKILVFYGYFWMRVVVWRAREEGRLLASGKIGLAEEGW